MPKSKNRIRTPRSLSEFAETLTTDRVMELLDLASSKASLNREALAQFSEVMTEYGEALYREYRVMAGCQVFMSRFQTFSKGAEDCWRISGVQTGDPVFGYATLDRVTAELKTFAAREEQPSVAALFLAAPAMPGTPYLLFALFSDAEGHQALCFGQEQVFHWAAHELLPVQRLLQALLTTGPRLNPDFFDVAAQTLQQELAARRSIPVETDAPQTWLGDWLRLEMRALGDENMANLGKCCDRVFRAVDGVLESYKENVNTRVAALDKAHAKQVKKLKGQLEKSELVASGIQARANRLDAELKALRKQHQTRPETLAQEPSATIAQALDVLFASPAP